jgi:organic hydroperoxide reductase OsmC/OhrA
MCGVVGDATMDSGTIEITLKACFKEMRERLERATGIAKAAEACAIAGSIEKGVEVALDVEQLVYEINTIVNAVSLFNRIAKN